MTDAIINQKEWLLQETSIQMMNSLFTGVLKLLLGIQEFYGNPSRLKERRAYGV
jgi:hypothetical protein